MKLIFTLLTTLLIPLNAMCADRVLSVAAMFKNEARFLKEWIEYHRMMGVEHFYLYNNESNDEYESVLEPYFETGIVELTDWPSEHTKRYYEFKNETETRAFNDALIRSKESTEWLALIDTSDFIIPSSNLKLSDTLQNQFSQYAGVCLNSQFYGTSNVKTCTSVLKDLLHKMKWDCPRNGASKSIVKPSQTEFCENPWYCSYKDDSFAVDSHKKRVDVVCREVNLDVMRINSYWTRDEDYLFNVKIPGSDHGGIDVKIILGMAFQMNDEFDDVASKFVPELEKCMQKSDQEAAECEEVLSQTS